ncbi:hypothetical protein [Nitratireductor sp. GCM10026969]|uniref:hypothetical protein n=1 Tax=Nitratireductor sp. GCM10026969 TaxID=3252645 RepID=UPI0036115654
MNEIVPVTAAYKLTIYVPETSPSPGSPAVGAFVDPDFHATQGACKNVLSP